MSQATQGCCSHDNICHTVKGTGYFFAATSVSLAVAIVAATVTLVAIGLLAWDGLFIYSVGVQVPMRLLWAIPVTLAFVALDLLIIANVGHTAMRLCQSLSGKVKQCGHKMLEHYRAIAIAE